MTRYAADTSVPADRSRAEIERTLARYGADGFLYGWDRSVAHIRFRMNERHVSFRLEMPDRADFALSETGRKRTANQTEAAWEQSQRQRWRALALVVKAKLEAVESEITTFEDEFLAHIVLPSGETFGEWATPQLVKAYADGSMPNGLLALPEARE